ncbi:hypothetical protein K8M07_04315 [Schnuerera sp. xch1]|uniref:hypothetical protein n=1 Tax=Schnuerera sp. xch1 TaxID=2874283 RepID=UPI001CBD6074|nr:hypothetical protein [Schnuerera sp. xch1]MBZ2174464.1 hypothetical protein [Schnuerera sp. xch1]
MKEFLANSWVVGIIGGILSGFFVTWITRIIFSKRDNKEYFQKVLQANKEIIYSIRPTISEGDIPKREIINALISSNSLKYGIEVKDMFTLEQICDELIKEVMDSSFISSETKNEYCERLLSLRNQKAEDERKLTIEYISNKENVKSVLEYRQKLTANMTMTLGIMVTLMSFIVTIILSLENQAIFIDLNNELFYLIPMVVSFATILIVLMVMTYTRIFKIIKDKREKIQFPQ